MPDFEIAPSYVEDVNFSGPPKPGIGSMGTPIVAPALANAAVVARGKGQQAVSGLSGIRGTIQAQVLAGSPGAATVVAMLSDGSKGTIALGFDVLNRPFAVLNDIVGKQAVSLVLLSTKVGAGVPVTLSLTWDSSVPTASLQAVSASVLSSKVATWTSFVPSSLWLGGTGGLLTYSDFNGTIQRVQVANTLSPQATTSQVTEDGVATFVGVASVTSACKVAHAMAAALVAGSTVIPKRS